MYYYVQSLDLPIGDKSRDYTDVQSLDLTASLTVNITSSLP